MASPNYDTLESFHIQTVYHCTLVTSRPGLATAAAAAAARSETLTHYRQSQPSLSLNPPVIKCFGVQTEVQSINTSCT